MNKFWTAADLDTLRRMYPKERDVDIANKLRRTWRAIKGKAQQLGLRRNAEGRAIQPWTYREIARLRELWLAQRPWREIDKALPGRGRYAIRNQVDKLGLMQRPAHCPQKHWTAVGAK